MIEEIKRAQRDGQLYESKQLKTEDKTCVDLLLEATLKYDEHWLAEQILKQKKLSTDKVDAHQVFADGQFNRFYMAAICILAKESGGKVKTYRAQESLVPRADSISNIEVEPDTLLAQLRSKDKFFNTAVKANSGMSIEIKL